MDTNIIMMILLAIVVIELIVVILAISICITKMNMMLKTALAIQSVVNATSTNIAKTAEGCQTKSSMMETPTVSQLKPQDVVNDLKEKSSECREGIIICSKCYSPLPVYGKFCPNCSTVIEGR